jgi:hypothetical protein
MTNREIMFEAGVGKSKKNKLEVLFGNWLMCQINSWKLP